jgi:hypothetical protein
MFKTRFDSDLTLSSDQSSPYGGTDWAASCHQSGDWKKPAVLVTLTLSSSVAVCVYVCAI